MSIGAADARQGEPDATTPDAEGNTVDPKKKRPAMKELGDGIITRGKLNASLGAGEGVIGNIKLEPVELMDYVSHGGTDDVFFRRGYRSVCAH
jgi:hypothetical protein